MVMPTKKTIKPMKDPQITPERIKACLKRLKSGKAAGPNGLKPELYKALGNSEKCLEALAKSYRNELEQEEKQDDWKESRTKMVEKKRKPQAKDLRPIALLNISYKIFMMIVKEEIEEHLRMNGEDNECQAGFTKGARIEDNLYILQYCVEESFKKKKALIVTSIDFKKAFDSVKRDVLIEVMKKYKINPKIMDTIANIYRGDKTNIDLGEGLEQEMEITSGIRQGCTGSTSLFKLITLVIMKKIEEEGRGFKNELLRIGTLFFADDALVLTENIEDAKFNVKLLVETGRKCGLEINKDKSNIMIFNMKDRPEQIEGIKVVSNVTYLGIKLDDKRNLFKTQKKEMIEKAQRLANLTYSVIEKSCNKVLVGKTFWKNVALPSILYGTSVVHLTETEIGKLQRIENGVYRKILGATKNTVAATLRGEIGASLMKTRIVQGKLKYVVDTLKGDKGILKEITLDIRERETKWWETVKKYMQEIDVKMYQLREMNRDELKNKTRLWDSGKWREELENKSSIEIYKQWKSEISEETIYDNTYASVILFKARSNSLNLNNIKRHNGGCVNCYSCQNLEEDLIHFLLFCPDYRDIRSGSRELQQPYKENLSEVAGNFLFNHENIENKKEILYCMWKKRARKVKEINRQN